MHSATARALKLALIGVGHVARFQLQAIAASDWTLVDAADLRPEAQQLLPPGTRFHLAADRLLAATSADLVLVATPNRTHFAVGSQVLQAGRPLLLEKPCSETAVEFDALLSLAAERNCPLSVALHARFAADLLWLHANSERLALGAPTAIECRFSDPYIVGGNVQPAADALGGSWMDSGINALSVVGTLVPPERLRLTGARFRPHGGMLDAAAEVLFEVPADAERPGCAVRIETRWDLGENRKHTRVAYDGTGSRVELDHSGERVDVYRGNRCIETALLANDRPRLVNHYLGVLADARQMLATGRTNLHFAAAIHRPLFAATAHRGTPWL